MADRQARSAARGWDGDKTLPHLDDCTLPADHDGPCDSAVTAGTSAATVEFEERHAHNMHVLGLIRDEPAWALARILRCETLEARRHYTRRMLQALDIYWFCAEGLPKGRYPRGRYTAEDWWNRYERYRALVEESIVV